MFDGEYGVKDLLLNSGNAYGEGRDSFTSWKMFSQCTKSTWVSKYESNSYLPVEFAKWAI